MPSPETFTHVQLPLTVEGVQLNVAAIHRDGHLAPIVFLHGFGSTKEDYADIVQQPPLRNNKRGRRTCGSVRCGDPTGSSLLKFLGQTLAALGFE